MLLAAVRGGYRYLRAVLHLAAAGLVSRPTKAPGSGGRASAGHEGRLDSMMVSRQVSGGKLDARAADAGFMARMVAWLVSVAYPVFHGGIAMLTTGIGTVPDSGMREQTQTQTDLVSGIGASPDSPGAEHALREEILEAGAEPAQPVAMDGTPETDTALITGINAGVPVMGIGAVGVQDRIAAEIYNGTGASIRGKSFAHAGMTAHIMTWIDTAWLDEKTLYVRQVYETEQDGNVLILH